jgi:hypothetical protein
MDDNEIRKTPSECEVPAGIRDRSTAELLSEIKGILLAEGDRARAAEIRAISVGDHQPRSAAVAALAGMATVNLYSSPPCSPATPYLPGWMARALPRGRHPRRDGGDGSARSALASRSPSASRKTLTEDVQWAKERMA